MSRWLLIFLAVVALGVVAVFAYPRLFPKPAPSDARTTVAVPTDAVPAGVAFYSSVRVAELWDSPLFAGTRDAKTESPTDALTKRLGLLGVDASALDRVTVVAHAEPKAPLTMAATGRKPIDVRAIVQRLGAEILKIEKPIPGYPTAVIYKAAHPNVLFADVGGVLVTLRAGARSPTPEQWAGLFHRTVEAHARADKLGTELAAPIVFALSGSGARGAEPVPVRGSDRLAPYRDFLKLDAAVAAITVGDAVTVRARIKFPDSATASAAKPQAETLVRLIKEQVTTFQTDASQYGAAGGSVAEVLDPLAQLFGKLTVVTDGADLVAEADVAVPASVSTRLAALRSFAEELDRRSVLHERFVEIGAAVSKFADRTDGRLPNNIYGTSAVPLLSWRVAVLPDLGYAALYNEFRLNEPWDSEHNKKLLDRMPDVYALPGVAAPKPGHTFVQGFVGPPGANPRPVFVRGDREGIALLVPDGTSNTAFCVEAADAVPWTMPADIEFDPKKAVPQLGGHYGPRATLLLLDGSARSPPLARLSEPVIRGLATTNGDERFEFFD